MNPLEPLCVSQCTGTSGCEWRQKQFEQAKPFLSFLLIVLWMGLWLHSAARRPDLQSSTPVNLLGRKGTQKTVQVLEEERRGGGTTNHTFSPQSARFLSSKCKTSSLRLRLNFLPSFLFCHFHQDIDHSTRSPSTFVFQSVIFSFRKMRTGHGRMSITQCFQNVCTASQWEHGNDSRLLVMTIATTRASGHWGCSCSH